MKRTVLIVLCVVCFLFVGVLCACQHADVPIIDTYTDEPIPTLEKPFYSFTPKPLPTPGEEIMYNLEYKFVEPIEFTKYNSGICHSVPLYDIEEIFSYNEYVVYGTVRDVRELRISFDVPDARNPKKLLHTDRYFSIVTFDVIKSYGSTPLVCTADDGGITFVCRQSTHLYESSVEFLEAGNECFVWLCDTTLCQKDLEYEPLNEYAQYYVAMPDIQLIVKYGDKGYNAKRFMTLKDGRGDEYTKVTLEDAVYYTFEDIESVITTYTHLLRHIVFYDFIRERGIMPAY